METVTYISHHGVLGQKWGVRRYQNLDGSLTEAGYRHVKEFRDGAIASNTKRYNKYADRYQKRSDKFAAKADKTSNLDKKEKYLSKSKEALSDKERAEATRDQVNNFYKNADLNTVLKVEADNKARTIKNVKTAAAVAGLATAGGLLGAGIIGAKSAAAAGMAALANIDTDAAVNTVTKYADMGIRAYADLRSFVIGTYLDEAMINWGRSGVAESLGARAGSLATDASNGFTNNFVPNSYTNAYINAASNTTLNATSAALLGMNAVNSMLADPTTAQFVYNMQNTASIASDLSTTLHPGARKG